MDHCAACNLALPDTSCQYNSVALMSYYWVKENFKQIRAIDEQELILFNLLTTATTITMTQKYPLSHVSEIRMTAQHCTEQRVVMHKLPIYICLSFPDASPDLLYTLTRHRHWPPGRRESERQGIRGGPVNAGAHGARYMGAGGTHGTAQGGWKQGLFNFQRSQVRSFRGEIESAGIRG